MREKQESTIEASRSLVVGRWGIKPRVGIVLGSGLGGLVDCIDVQARFPFEQLPGFCRATALGHQGMLVCGQLEGIPIVALQGRLHRYEGYSVDQITHPIRVMKGLGIEQLLVSNAAGGLHVDWQPGDVMLLTDHLRGPCNPPIRLPTSIGPASMIYDERGGTRLMQVACEAGIELRKGVYASLVGPTFETRAEYRMLRRLGADAVGMSTVPEAIVAHELRLAVVGLSVITNVANPDRPSATHGHDVVSVAERVGPKMQTLVRGFVRSIELGTP